MNEMGVHYYFHSGFETCFAPKAKHRDVFCTQHPFACRCLALGAKHISNRDFGHHFEQEAVGRRPRRRLLQHHPIPARHAKVHRVDLAWPKGCCLSNKDNRGYRVHGEVRECAHAGKCAGEPCCILNLSSELSSELNSTERSGTKSTACSSGQGPR